MTSLHRQHLVILALLGLIAYLPTLRVGFLYDDHMLIESNPYVRSWSTVALKHDFTKGVFNSSDGKDFYRPVQTLSTRIEYTLWKLNPLPYHLTNILLHVGNILLLAEFLMALGFERLPVMLASSLFAVHPIIIEPMLMVSGRGELLGTFFSLSSLLLLLRNNAAAVSAGVIAFLVALFSKESAIIVPLLFILALNYQKAPPARYWPLVPLSIILSVYLSLRAYAIGVMLPAIGTKQALFFGVMEFPKVLVSYARILLLPWDLHTDRLLPPLGSFWFLYTLCFTSFSAWVLCRGSRWAIFSLAWFVLTFLPKAALMITGSFMSDHWAYPALPAITLPIALGLVRGWESPHADRRLLSRGIFLVLILSELTTVYLNTYHRDTDEKLYRSALQHTTSETMKYNLGMELLRQGRTEEALPYIQSTYAQDPTDPSIGRALAYTYWKLGQSQRAIPLLENTLRQSPNDPPTQELLNEIEAHSKKL